MIREWADADQNDMIDEALIPPAKYLAMTWNDDDAWAAFEGAMQAENS